MFTLKGRGSFIFVRELDIYENPCLIAIMSKARSSIFLAAAERLFDFSIHHFNSEFNGPSPFCCDCIEEARCERDEHFNGSRNDSAEQKFFAAMFEPPANKKDSEGLGWWKTDNDMKDYKGHDYESRLLALLLCHEMLKR